MLSEVTVQGPVWKTYIPKPREEGREETNWKAEWDIERFSRTEKAESWFSSGDTASDKQTSLHCVTLSPHPHPQSSDMLASEGYSGLLKARFPRYLG